MFKKITTFFVMLAMLSITIVPALAQDGTTADTANEPVVCTMDYTPVCGTNNKTYSNECTANSAGVDASYAGECKDVTVAANQTEDTKDIQFAGMLVEIGSTDVPTTIIVRQNNTITDYTVNIDSDTLLGQIRNQYTQLSDWIPGDQIKVIGVENENTNEIDASIVVNLSINLATNEGINGWVTKIDKDAKEIAYQWANVEHTFKYDDSTRFVAGLKNPAAVDDLQINDRIRGRLLTTTDGETPTAKIVVVLRRGEELFMKIRTFVPKAQLVRLDSTVVPTTIQVKILPTPGLRANDVNNLIGTEGTLVTVNVTEDTNIVRKYFGKTGLDEFSAGDALHIVGRVNDDGTVDAKMIKNESIWKTSTEGRAGVVTAIDVPGSNITIDWTPVTYTPQFQLKKVLQQQNSSSVSAQTVGKKLSQAIQTIREKVQKAQLGKNLLNRIKETVSEKVGQFVRAVKYKQVEIERIQHPQVQLKNLIKRGVTVKVRIDITEDTKIVVGTNEDATINDIQIGDKVRIRGVRHAKLPIVTADTIVVVNSLPEIEEDLSTNIDDINEVVEVITTDDEEDTATDTEQEIDVESTNEETSTETESEIEIGSGENDVETGTEIEVETETEINTETGTEVEEQTETNTETETESETETNTETETENQTGTEVVE